MATFIDIGETIEGDSIECITRKWTSRGLKKHPIINKAMTLYITDLNSAAKIIKTRPAPTDEELMHNTKSFHRDQDDTLEADALSIYIDNPRQIRPEVIKGATHRHGAQYVLTRKHTIAEIKVPLSIFKKKLGYSNNIQLEK